MLNPTWPEISLFVVLVCVSLVLFGRRVAPIITTILRSRRDPGFQLDRIDKRIKDAIWEVALQGKVIKERPLPGIAHAFVFWGFCAFALISLNHFAEGAGFEVLSRESVAGRAYFGFVAVFAVAVLIGITGLAYRRFVVRPKWLGSLSPESGIIAGLIALLMITYLLEFFITPGTIGGKANWWVHTLAILVFLPLIPKTKHFHLVISPVTIFLSRGSFAKIPPLQGDEDFGLVTGKDLTDIDALQAFSCVECGRCTQHCPANNTGKVLNPKQIALGIRGYLREHGPNADEPIVDGHVLDKMLWQCTTCGSCEYQCPVGIEHLPIIIGLRRGQVNTGKWEDEYGGKLFLAVEKNGNSLGMAASERDKFIQKNSLPIFDGSQEYCLWLGCMGAFDPQGREIILALTRVMNYLGITYGVLKKERCTGDPVRRLGNDYLFTQVAEQNLEQINAAHAARFLSICPHCVRTMTEDWKEAGATVCVEHHSEFLARHKERLPKSMQQEQIVYHDPCYLGRYRDIYDQPRAAAGIGGQVIDPPRSHERSFCCGAGGGMMFLGEEEGKRINIERAEELVATGAPVVGAACPFCNSMFRDALKQVSQTPPKLLDIAQIAAAALPESK